MEEFLTEELVLLCAQVKGWPSLDAAPGSAWLLSESRGRGSRYKASWGAQFAALLWRSWLSVRKEPLLVRVRVLQTIIIALLVSVLYFGQVMDQTGLVNINAALFTTITNMTFQNVLAVIKVSRPGPAPPRRSRGATVCLSPRRTDHGFIPSQVFCTERAVFKREHMAAMYRVDAYFLARSTAELPIFLALPILYTFIVYFAIGLNSDPLRFFTCVAITSLIGLVATSFGESSNVINSNYLKQFFLHHYFFETVANRVNQSLLKGYFISCAANNISTALSIGSPSVIPLLLYGGFFVNLEYVSIN